MSITVEIIHIFIWVGIVAVDGQLFIRLSGGMKAGDDRGIDIAIAIIVDVCIFCGLADDLRIVVIH